YDLTHGFDFDAYDIPVDVIQKAGHRGNFLMEEHTLKHIRDFRLSPLLHGLDAKGVHINPQTAALKAYVDIDQNHHPEPLSKPILDELDRILASAEKTARELM
ncbi:MAG: hypothetical protein JRI93_15090, partial [Deltaproteobacteria bacterium]|nr:hypothetical protein [Deltaproteobacteria bacterium]